MYNVRVKVSAWFNVSHSDSISAKHVFPRENGNFRGEKKNVVVVVAAIKHETHY